MIEAALMLGNVQGSASAWQFIGSTNLLTTDSAPITPGLPAGIREGDLLVGVMSPRSEQAPTEMLTNGWQRWRTGNQDYLCAARYVAGLAAPRWYKGAASGVFTAVLAFRTRAWSTFTLAAQSAPAAPADLGTTVRNSLVLAIGVTPGTTRDWQVSVGGTLAPVSRIERALAPGMQVSSLSVDYPQPVLGLMVDALSGSERNLILTAY
ncbi:hypothetical protein [Pseudomonas sp. KCJK9111]|uniref:hypothetical protein n=1 Tax=Pseudomonas sp. KCJK9111 TaxID=3344555 RepID=UPI003906CCD9